MALSRNKIKYIHSLKDKKNRVMHKAFVAEGEKLILDLLASGCRCQLLAGSKMGIEKLSALAIEEIVEAAPEELKRASSLKTSSSFIAVFYQPESDLDDVAIDKQLNLVLDGVQDPGNLGTIVRVADWFGIKSIICSHDTCDVYNPKAVQATMGAINRVKIGYTNIVELLGKYSYSPLYGAFLDGENIYHASLSETGFIVMGNEGNGIRPEVEKMINHRLFIPNFPLERRASESLNVAMAAGIICSEFRRR